MIVQIPVVCGADEFCQRCRRGGMSGDLKHCPVLQLGESVNKTISMALFYGYKNPQQYPNALVCSVHGIYLVAAL